MIFSDRAKPQLSNDIQLEPHKEFLSYIADQKTELTSSNFEEKMRKISTSGGSKELSISYVAPFFVIF